ncbi:MAG: sigma 54-interacting transcriptional regulator [Pseudomonadota bacterium]
MMDTTVVKVGRPVAKGSGRDLNFVCVFSGLNVVDARPVLVRDEITMGRTILPNLGLTTPDSTMSRHHFRLQRSGAGVVIEDLGSSNGTFVNRQEIHGTSNLHPGDVIRAGETLFLLLETPPSPPETPRDDDFVTCNAGLQRILGQIARVAGSDISVLLLGETGTGKDVLAQHLHRLSARNGRFVPVNCSAIPATLLEASLFGHERGAFTGADRASIGMFRTADRGTLFLDEIGEMEPGLQAKLLRSLETRSVIPVGAAREIRVNVRIVAATSRSRLELESGRIREDLLGRLEDLVVQLSPLRERREDILFFAAREMGIEPGQAFGTADVAEALLLYPWPRNVRELVRSVRAALLLHDGSPPLRWEDLKEGIRHFGGLATPMPGGRAGELHAPVDSKHPFATPFRRDGMDELRTTTKPTAQQPAPSRETLEALIAKCGGNVSALARQLGKDRKQIYRWLERYGLKA